MGLGNEYNWDWSNEYNWDWATSTTGTGQRVRLVGWSNEYNWDYLAADRWDYLSVAGTTSRRDPYHRGAKNPL